MMMMMMMMMIWGEGRRVMRMRRRRFRLEDNVHESIPTSCRNHWLVLPQKSQVRDVRKLCTSEKMRNMWNNWVYCISQRWGVELLGVVALTFCKLSKIFSRNLCIAEIVLLMIISSWNFVHKPKAMLWAHIQIFSLKLSPQMWFLALCIFARLFWRAPETLVKQPQGSQQFFLSPTPLHGRISITCNISALIYRKYKYDSNLLENNFSATWINNQGPWESPHLVSMVSPEQTVSGQLQLAIVKCSLKWQTLRFKNTWTPTFTLLT